MLSRLRVGEPQFDVVGEVVAAQSSDVAAAEVDADHPGGDSPDVDDLEQSGLQRVHLDGAFRHGCGHGTPLLGWCGSSPPWPLLAGLVAGDRFVRGIAGVVGNDQYLGSAQTGEDEGERGD